MAKAGQAPQRRDPGRTSDTLFLLFAVAIVAGGMTFNVTTIALPKIIDERAGVACRLPHRFARHRVFSFGALTQLLWAASSTDLHCRRSLRLLGLAAAWARPCRPRRPACRCSSGLACDGSDLRAGGRERRDGRSLRASPVQGQGVQRALLPWVHDEWSRRATHRVSAWDERLWPVLGIGSCVRSRHLSVLDRIPDLRQTRASVGSILR